MSQTGLFMAEEESSNDHLHPSEDDQCSITLLLQEKAFQILLSFGESYSAIQMGFFGRFFFVTHLEGVKVNNYKSTQSCNLSPSFESQTTKRKTSDPAPDICDSSDVLQLHPM